MKKETFTQKCIKIGIFNPNEYLCKQYKNGLSCNEIAEKLTDKYAIDISAKAISEKIKSIMPLRSKSEGKKNAIKRGRMIYIKKPDYMKYKHKNISAKIRWEVLHRDNLQCQICGGKPSDGYSLEVHHKKPGNNNTDNLITLCFLCHRGGHYNLGV